MRHQCSFEIDGTDPRAARLDQVLRPIRDTQVIVAIDGRNVSCSKPAVFGPLIPLTRGLEVSRRDPWSANFQFAHRFSIVGTDAAGVNDANIYEWHGHALSGVDGDSLVIADSTQRRFRDAADGGHRAGFCHSPAMNQLYS